MQGLFALATDSAAGVRREVCVGLVELLMVRPDTLTPHLSQIIEYMLMSNQDGDEGVALESAEFWMAFCNADVDADMLKPFLPKLVPVLMKNMVSATWQDIHMMAAAAGHGMLINAVLHCMGVNVCAVVLVYCMQLKSYSGLHAVLIQQPVAVAVGVTCHTACC